MTTGHLGPVELCACARCRGVWFPAGQLAALARSGAAGFERLIAAVRQREPLLTRALGAPRCPACRIPLDSIEYPSLPGVSLDACQVCHGFWTPADTILLIAARLGVDVSDTPRPVPPRAPAVTGSTRPAAAPARLPAAPLAPGRRKCPGCGEANSARDAVCWACGHSLLARVAGECPRCHGSLRELNAPDVRISACEDCSAVWLADGRLGELLALSSGVKAQLLAEIAMNRQGRARPHESCPTCPECDLILLHAPLLVSPEPVHTCSGCTANLIDLHVFEGMLRGGVAVGRTVAYGCT
jgi:Zn-finger nucleic acid-binding protein